MASCLVCGACEEACSRGLEITETIIAAKTGPGGPAARLMLLAAAADRAARLAPFARMLARAARILPPDSGLRLKLGLPAEAAAGASPPAGEEGTASRSAVFSGCFARHLEPEIELATLELAALAHGERPSLPAGQACCGLAAKNAGRGEQARELARRNIAAFARAERIIVPCASCYHQLKTYPALLAADRDWQQRAADFAARVVEFSSCLGRGPAATALARAMAPLDEEKTAVWHDPCHLRFPHRISAEPRRLLGLIKGLRLVEPESGPRCCGMGGLFAANFPELSERITAPALAGLTARRPGIIVTSCSGCLIQWRRHAAGVEVLHPATLLAARLRRALSDR